MTTIIGTESTGEQTVRATSWWAIIKHNAEMTAAIMSGLLIIAGWVASHWNNSVFAVGCFLAAFVIGGFAKAKEGIFTLVQEKKLDVNMLMILAAMGSAAIGYWTEGAILIFIFALSGALETYAMDKSSREISQLVALQPQEARLFEAGIERKVSVEAVEVGQLILVKPGDRVPLDGSVVEGTSSLDQSALTGESIPVEVNPGDDVLAGTVNGDSGLTIRVQKRSDDSVFQKMIRMVHQAQQEKPPQQHFVEKFEKVYVYVVLAAVTLWIVVPPLGWGWTWEESVYRGMVLLVVASPCALVASIMPALLSALSNGARRGVLFKGGRHLEMLQGTRVVAFDKTGTLTQGKPEVTDIVAFAHFDEQEVVRVAASIETMSSHPLAEAIVRKADDLNVALFHPSGVTTEAGFGVRVCLDGKTWRIGKREYIDAKIDNVAEQRIRQFTQQGKTVVFIQRASELVGLIGLQDVMRSEAQAAVRRLKKYGVKTVMLTGDHEETAKAIAAQTGVDLYYANCLPQQKVQHIASLQQSYGKTVMVGDGINDAPALASSTVGISMGAGTGVALETADVVLVNDALQQVAYVLSLANRAGRIIKQNIAFSLSVILALVISNVLQYISLPFGVIGHEGSTILVILNGLRLLR